MVGSEAAIRVKSRKPPAENFIDFRFGHRLHIGGGAHDIVGDQVG